MKPDFVNGLLGGPVSLGRWSPVDCTRREAAPSFDRLIGPGGEKRLHLQAERSRLFRLQGRKNQSNSGKR
jgi:hypothetical protein